MLVPLLLMGKYLEYLYDHFDSFTGLSYQKFMTHSNSNQTYQGKQTLWPTIGGETAKWGVTSILFGCGAITLVSKHSQLYLCCGFSFD
jgi:hypothetical protein